MTMLMLDPKEVIAEDNIRFDSGDLDGLANSIQRNGVLSPVLVTRDDDGAYRLIAGYRRRAAAELVGVQLPAYEITDIDWTDATSLEAQFAENVFRLDLTPVEKAQVTLDLKDAGLNQREIAAATGIAQRKVKDWQKLGRADLSEVDGAADLNEQQLLELAGQVDEDYIGPTVTRYLNETMAGGHPRFRNLEDAYTAEEQGREKEQAWAKIRPLLDRLAKLSVPIEESYVSISGKRITDSGSDDASQDYAGYIVLNLEDHRTESCHRAYVQDDYSGVKVVEYCNQPKRHLKEDATVQVPDADKIRKAQTRKKTENKKEREAKAEQWEAYGDYLRDGTIPKPDQFELAIDAMERAFPWEWEKDIARYLGLDLEEPPSGSLRNKWQFALDAFTEGKSVHWRANFMSKVRVIQQHRQGTWRFSDDDRATVLSVETFGKNS